MTPQHPAAPETETDTNGLTEAERDEVIEWCHRWACSHGTDDYCGCSFDHLDREMADQFIDRVLERIVAERVRVVEGERDAEAEQSAYWHTMQQRYEARAESAEAAHEAEKAAHEEAEQHIIQLTQSRDRAEAAHERLRAGVEALAERWRSQDNTGEWGNHDKTFCAMAVEDLFGGGEAR